MDRYTRDYIRPRGTQRGYDADQAIARGTRRYDADQRVGRGARGYDTGYHPGGYRRERAGYGQEYGASRPRGDEYRGARRGLHVDDRTFWGTEPGRELTSGYSDYSPRGRFGGYFGAWDLRPMMAGYDKDLVRAPRRNRYDVDS